MAFPESIRSLHLVLTSRCNLHCAYCWQPRRSRRTMGLKTLHAAIGLVSGSRHRSIELVFSGGEPLLVFPLIRSGQGAHGSAPMSVMEQEHESAGRALDRLRHLTDDYTVPAGACNTWRALWRGLEQLDTDLSEFAKS